MKKTILLSVLILIGLGVNIYSSSFFLAKMSVEQGFMLSKPEGLENEFDATNSISAYFAYKDRLSTFDGLFVYNLDYRGPGIKGYSYQTFGSRSLDNYLLAKLFYPVNDDIKIDFKADFLYEFYNTGTEKWTKGLYNFGKVGFGPGISWNLGNSYIFTSDFNISYVWFPNYTDLETEVMNILNNNISGSIKQNFWQFGLNLSFETKIFLLIVLDYSLIYRLYPDLYINSENILTKERQQDLINILKLNTMYQSKTLDINLSFSITNYDSNYNYRNIVDYSTYPIAIDFNKDYLDYTSFNLSLSFIFLLSSSSRIDITPFGSYKKYSNRHPRKNDGTGGLDYSKIEWDLYYGFSVGYKYQSDEVFSFEPTYSLQIGSSNNKDMSLNNNYVSNYLGFKFILEY